jgi:hypothetical protein
MGLLAMETLKPTTLPVKTVNSGSFSEAYNPDDPVMPEQPDPPPATWPYLKTGVLQTYKTIFFATALTGGPYEQVISTAPGETVEVSIELTRRLTIEEENQSTVQSTLESASEFSMQDELTDRVSTVLQDTHTSSVSATVSGSIAIVSGSVSGSDTYSSTQTKSHEQMKRTLKQSTQRVSQQLMKSYTIRAKRTEDVTTRDTYRRLLKNDTDDPMHFGFRKVLQEYRASTQYLGPQLVWHILVPNPGAFLGKPRVVGDHFLPGAFAQKMARQIAVADFPGLQGNWNMGTPVWDYIVPVNYQETRLGARFLNGETSINFVAQGTGYKVTFVASIDSVQDVSISQTRIRFAATIVATEGTAPKSYPIKFPDFHLYSVDRAALIAWDNIGSQKAEDFLGFYRGLIIDSLSLAPRPAGDLRQEERQELIRRALLRLNFGDYAANNQYAVLAKGDDLLDMQASFYQLFPPFFGAAPSWTRQVGLVSEYDVTKGGPPAKYGASINWQIPLDADARRTEFINSPLARVGIPVKRGREREAVTWLATQGRFQISQNLKDFLDKIEMRRQRETHATDLGLSDADVDPSVVTPYFDEETAGDSDLAKALYPIKDVFVVSDPLQGYIYEPIVE